MNFLAAIGRVVLAFFEETGRLSLFTWSALTGLLRPPFFWRLIGQQIPELTPGSRGQGPRHPLVELPGRQASPAAPQIFVRANLMCPLDGGRVRALRFVKHRSTMSNTFRAGSHLA